MENYKYNTSTFEAKQSTQIMMHLPCVMLQSRTSYIYYSTQKQANTFLSTMSQGLGYSYTERMQ